MYEDPCRPFVTCWQLRPFGQSLAMSRLYKYQCQLTEQRFSLQGLGQ